MRGTFGYPATWSPLDNSPAISATVLYKAPSAKFDFGDTDFSLEKHVLEFYQNDFPGLFESVGDASNEKISVEVTEGDFQLFLIKRCEKKTDGFTIKAYLTAL